MEMAFSGIAKLVSTEDFPLQEIIEKRKYRFAQIKKNFFISTPYFSYNIKADERKQVCGYDC